MPNPETQQYFNLLEIISNVNQIVDQNKGVDETLSRIIGLLQVIEDEPVPGHVRIIFDEKEYTTKHFVETGFCSERNFKTRSGKTGHLHLFTEKEKVSAEKKNDSEQFYFLNSMVSILLRFINQSEDKEFRIKPKDDNRMQGTISSEFLQKFLNKWTFNRDIFHDLMPFKVKEILLISSLYDAYAIEREGRFSEHMLGQYGQLNLNTFPRITGVTSLNQALRLLSNKHFDLIIYMVGVDKKMPLVVSQDIKKKYPYIPIYLLLNNNSDVAYFLTMQGKLPFIDHLFAWNGDPDIFFSMIKFLEDGVNADNDTRLGEVRIILVVEDSPVYYSRYLSFLYRVVMEQTKRIIEDVSTDQLYKVLRMRARPKILLATNFDEAISIINKYKKYMLCLVTDVKFKKAGEMDEDAGIKLLEYVHHDLKNLPTILQSSDNSYAEVAIKYNSLFINKQSETLYKDFQDFLTNYLGFGDFVFKDKEGNQIAIAKNMKSFENHLKIIPDESLIYHADRDHFSMWLLARGEMKAASIINPKKVSDFKDAKELRTVLLDMIKENRNEQEAGNIIPFNYEADISEHNIYTLSEGSLGGKGRGLSFINALIHNYDFGKYIPDIRIRSPKTLIIGTQEFDSFIKSNKLDHIIYKETSYEKIRKAFLKSRLSDELISKLTFLMGVIKRPIAIRSSGMFEDSLTQPFAGIFDTYLLPNNHPDQNERLRQLLDAIKLVFASAFSSTAKGYVKAINYKIEEEKMAIVIQEVVGNQFGELYYPHISGVAQSYNYYPFAHMKPEEGFGLAAIGLGKYVVEGNKAYRFSPLYPGTEINTPKDQFNNSQVRFYAINMEDANPDLLIGESAGLTLQDISIAEKQGTLKHTASTYVPENNLIYPGISKPGPRIVNFANILKFNYIPLAKSLEMVLELGRDAMGTAVEIEYAVDLNKDNQGRASFYILQIKPLISNMMECEVNMDEIKDDNFLLYSEQGMGNGCIDDIYDILYVDTNRFDKSKTKEMALEIEKINAKMTDEERPYILIGPGRWGTRDPWIGIPVKWHQISNAKVIVETSLNEFPLDASSGSHFFHNVTSMNVGYFTVQPELLKSYIQYDKLEKQGFVKKYRYFNHVRFKKPVSIKMDGRKRIYLIKMT